MHLPTPIEMIDRLVLTQARKVRSLAMEDNVRHLKSLNMKTILKKLTIPELF